MEHDGNRHHCHCTDCRAYMARYRRWWRGQRLTVVTYDGGEPREHRAYIANDHIDKRRAYSITDEGRAYLRALKQESVA